MYRMEWNRPNRCVPIPSPTSPCVVIKFFLIRNATFIPGNVSLIVAFSDLGMMLIYRQSTRKKSMRTVMPTVPTFRRIVHSLRLMGGPG